MNPVMIARIGENIFHVFGALNFVSLPIVWALYPETANRTLEEMVSTDLSIDGIDNSISGIYRTSCLPVIVRGYGTKKPTSADSKQRTYSLIMLANMKRRLQICVGPIYRLQ